MTETISTSSYERRVRISSRHNTETGAVEELHARITGKAVTLTRVSTARKPRSFWISEDELDKLMVTRYTYRDWLKRRDETLKEAKSLVNQGKLQPGDLNFREEYHEGSHDETYEVYVVGGYSADNRYHEEQVVWEHVAIEDLVERIKDAQARVAEQEQASFVKTAEEAYPQFAETAQQAWQGAMGEWKTAMDEYKQGKTEGLEDASSQEWQMKAEDFLANQEQEYEDMRVDMEHHYTGGE